MHISYDHEDGECGKYFQAKFFSMVFSGLNAVADPK